MALTSHMVPLGTEIPDVTLPDLDGVPQSSRELRDGRPLLVIFSCNHCPYVRHLEDAIGEFATPELRERVAVVAISSNDVEQYPDDDVHGLRDQQQRAGWTFPYLVDADQSAAKTFNAACTPDFFLYGGDGLLAYRGAFDDSTPKNTEPVTGYRLRGAIDEVLDCRVAPEPQKPSMGCGIKWKPGSEPDAVVFVSES